MKRILITGGSGFIGRNLTEGLRGRWKVFAPSHRELELLDYDALEAYVVQNRIDAIVHGAIQVPMFHGGEQEYFHDMQMFLNMEKLSRNVEKVLYFGSGAEYDKRFHIRNVREEDWGTSIPVTEYGLAKYTMNAITRNSRNLYNLRLFGVFGKYELWQLKFLSNLCCKAVFDLPLTVRKDCWFNFLYIDDLVEVVDRLLRETPSFHEYNVCHTNSFLLSTLAELVRKVSEKELEIRMLSPERNLDYTADNGRLLREFPDLHITEMEAALTALYRYYEENRHLIDYEVLRQSR